MSITRNYTIATYPDSGPVVTSTFSVTEESEYLLSTTFAANTTDSLVSTSFLAAKVKGVYIYSDADITIETNNSSSPADTLTISAGVPLCWVEDMDYTCPFTTNVTALYFTTGATAVTEFYMSILLAQ